MRRTFAPLASVSLLALTACSTVEDTVVAAASDAAKQTTAAAKQNVQQAALNTVFEQYDAAQLAMSPQGKSFRGIRDEDYGKWDEFSNAARTRDYQLTQNTAKAMRAAYDLGALSTQDALSYRLFDYMAKRDASLWPYRDNGYLFDQMRGAQSRIPAFLIGIHRVSSVEDASAYIQRIEGIGPLLDAMTAESKRRADNGVMPPDWAYPYVINDIENLLNAGDDNAILADFDKKLMAVLPKLPEGGQAENSTAIGMMGMAREAWNSSAKPAYERLLAEMKRQQKIAPTDDGVWRFPNGADYYKALLANYTTTDLSADEIHNIGLREVERIHGEMRAIMAKVGFEGTLQEFFQFTRTDDRFFYTNREDYLRDAQAKIDALEKKLPEFFGVLPKDPFVIKPVEAFREKSAGKAFYQRPAPDGSRPGTYYVNLYNLRDMSKNELEALAYHEALPGHHLQLSIQTQLGDVPPFRRFGGVTAYSEGWGLYSEELGKDMGFYTDPYSDFGRLGMELWRACRLVVDTGIHEKRWSREKAIQYLTDNTPNPDGDIRKAIERYIVYPGQATAYMIGKLKIMELRAKAREELGSQFDIRGFHDVILKSGPVPLSIMEENVEAWIASEKAS